MYMYFFWAETNGADPDQNETSDQGLHCLLTECSIKFE